MSRRPTSRERRQPRGSLLLPVAGPAARRLPRWPAEPSAHVTARLMTVLCAGWLALAIAPAPVRADVILTTQNLNDALKNMGRLQQRAAAAAAPARAEDLFALGLEAEALATLLSNEVIAHGNQEQLLLDLALERTRELKVAIAYSREKEKFFYDGAAFRECLALAPNGPRAVDAQYKVIEGEFYQSAGSDLAGVLAAARAKTGFLAAHPRYAMNAEMHLMLAIDYRDLVRLYGERGDAANRTLYRDRVRRQYRTIVRRFPGTEQAGIASKLLARFDEEMKAPR